jgi:hypothetical protein
VASGADLVLVLVVVVVETSVIVVVKEIVEIMFLMTVVVMRAASTSVVTVRVRVVVVLEVDRSAVMMMVICAVAVTMIRFDVLIETLQMTDVGYLPSWPCSRSLFAMSNAAPSDLSYAAKVASARLRNGVFPLTLWIGVKPAEVEIVTVVLPVDVVVTVVSSVALTVRVLVVVKYDEVVPVTLVLVRVYVAWSTVQVFVTLT